MNFTETAKMYAAQILPEIDAYAARAAQTPSGSWPGSVERDNTRRLRTAIAMELIGGTDERLRDLIRAYAYAAECVHQCTVHMTQLEAVDADDAIDQLDLHSRAIVTELSEDLAAYCERLEGSKT
jgi:hypothetical protein